MNPETDTAEQLLDKADALMRRHRAFVAQVPTAPVNEAMPPAELPSDESPELPDDDDLPVLTDVVDSTEAIGGEAHAATMSGEAVAAETQRWLDEELPGAVLSVLDGLADHLVATITERMRAEVLDTLRKPPAD